MKINLQGKKTLVIGGARGIGAEIVRECASYGAAVGWSCRSAGAPDSPSAKLLAELHARGTEAFAMSADSTSENATAALFAEVERRWGGHLDHLVYNTGFTSPIYNRSANDGPNNIFV